MCVALQYLPDVEGPVPCRNCWQCRETRVNDLIGRCIAESHTAALTVAVTLTYSGDTVNSSVLVYPDFQNFIKRLRAAGHAVRYIVAGEYGSKKGRAHWHAILFFQSNPPELPEFEARAHWPFWSNWDEGRGFVYFQKPDYNGFRYVLKYVLKDVTRKSSHLAMSKKPPLGHEYFMQLADDYVEQKLSPQSGTYQFRGIKNALGKHRRFHLQGRMREMFCEAFIIRYRAHHKRDYPYSDFLEAQEDRWTREDLRMTVEQWREYLDAKAIVIPAPLPPDGRQPVKFTVFKNGEGFLLTHHRDGTFTLNHGKENEEWHVESVAQLDAALEYLGATPQQREHTTGRKRPHLQARSP